MGLSQAIPARLRRAPVPPPPDRRLPAPRPRRTLPSDAGVYQALPGPEATELACYFGLLAKGYFAAFLAGLGFILPGFLIMLFLSWIYGRFSLFQNPVRASRTWMGTSSYSPIRQPAPAPAAPGGLPHGLREPGGLPPSHRVACAAATPCHRGWPGRARAPSPRRGAGLPRLVLRHPALCARHGAARNSEAERGCAEGPHRLAACGVPVPGRHRGFRHAVGHLRHAFLRNTGVPGLCKHDVQVARAAPLPLPTCPSPFPLHLPSEGQRRRPECGRRAAFRASQSGRAGRF